MKRRIQVFVSSTYRDLRDERQAAVETILKTGDIPAGMELFAAGDESQWEVIKRWIDESDAFMLILGGRYGTIEPKSGKSYIQLEYEYASQQGKHPFVVVLSDEQLQAMRKADTGVPNEALEHDHPNLYDAFRASLLKSRLCRMFEYPDHVRLAIHESLGYLKQQYDLKGWVSGAEVTEPKPLVDEMGRLRDELAHSQSEVKSLKSKIGYLEKELRKYKSLRAEAEAMIETIQRVPIQIPRSVTGEQDDTDSTLALCFKSWGDSYVSSAAPALLGPARDFVSMYVHPKLQLYKLVDSVQDANVGWTMRATPLGEEVLRILHVSE